MRRDRKGHFGYIQQSRDALLILTAGDPNQVALGGMTTSSPSLSGSLGNRSGINNSED
jgi:hypothetical protein